MQKVVHMVACLPRDFTQSWRLAAVCACGAICQALHAWHPGGGVIAGGAVLWDAERVSAHRGPRQLRRRPNAADFGLVRERMRFAVTPRVPERCWVGPRGRGQVLHLARQALGRSAEASACKMQDLTPADAIGAPAKCPRTARVRDRAKRSASARGEPFRSVTTARKLSRPSMGRDMPLLPTAHAPTGRVGRGLFRRRVRHVVGHRWHVYKGAGRGQAIDAAV